MSTPVTALVVSYNTGPRLKECVYALLSDPEITHTIVVNNGNSNAYVEWLRSLATKHENMTLLTGHGNVGFGAGINLAARTTGDGDLLIINPDAVLRRGSIGPLQSVGRHIDAPWIVGGRIYNLAGKEERGSRRRELTLWRAITSFFGWNTWTLENSPPPSQPVPMPVISGAFFLTSKESFERLGGFDEGYFLHVEDVDLCRRCRQLGGTVMYDPRAGALHYGSTSQAPPYLVARHKVKSLDRYFRKFGASAGNRIAVAMAMPMMYSALWLRDILLGASHQA